MTHEEKCLGTSWGQALKNIFQEPVMLQLRDFLEKEKADGQVIYPRSHQVFRAFHLTPLNEVKIVFLGQDPYHGPGQAEGLCFSVPEGVPFPPSLRNIFQELSQDLKQPIHQSGSLVHWAQQGVFLLNTRLTVRGGEPLSHNHPGWMYFTEQVLKILNQKKEPIAFVLLGSHAQSYQKILTNPAHKMICAPHPSPLSAYRGFFGSRIFSKLNQFLSENYSSDLEW